MELNGRNRMVVEYTLDIISLLVKTFKVLLLTYICRRRRTKESN